jgi:NADH-quinone oxidoreductase subunit M
MGLTGSLLQMFNHGTVTAMLFLLVGVLYDRAHHRDIEGFGGLAGKMPTYAGVTAVAFFAALGLPGLSSFISEALVFLGSFQADGGIFAGPLRGLTMFMGNNLFRISTVISASGVIITAAYMLWTYQRIFLGPLNEKYAGLAEIKRRELFTLVPLGLIVIFLGIYPLPILRLFQESIGLLLKAVVGG